MVLNKIDKPLMIRIRSIVLLNRIDDQDINEIASDKFSNPSWDEFRDLV